MLLPLIAVSLFVEYLLVFFLLCSLFIHYTLIEQHSDYHWSKRGVSKPLGYCVGGSQVC